MDKHSGRKQDVAANTSANDYVVVCFMEDADQANECQKLLESNDIPALVQSQDVSGSEHTYTIMVQEEYLDEAHVLIESQASYDDFYDFALDDDEVDDFNDHMFEEDF